MGKGSKFKYDIVYDRELKFFMSRSKSSKQWLQAHFSDYYVKKSQAEGYRSRAVYKLQEIDEKEQLLKPGITVVDLGAAPGGWVQYASKKLQGKGSIIAMDILPMDPLPGVTFIQGDFTEDAVFEALLARIPERGVDLLLSDMAPNMSGMPSVDIPRAMGLAELALDFAQHILKPNGTLLMKVFQGTGFNELLLAARANFQKVSIRKPQASRPQSREMYLLAKEYQL